MATSVELRNQRATTWERFKEIVDGAEAESRAPSAEEKANIATINEELDSLGERIANELGRGTLDQVYIKGENGYVFLMAVGSEAVLTVLARKEAKLGLLLLDMRRASSDLAKLI